MGRHYQILLPLLSLFLVRVDLTDLYPLKLSVKVLKVYDGDTVLVARGSYQMRVRFVKVDAPERGQPFLLHKKDAGLLSTNCLLNLINLKEPHTLTIYKTDMYKRILGELGDLSLKLIQNGCAVLYPYAEFSSRNEKMHFLREFKKAKAQHVGLWRYGGIKRPDIYRRFKKRNAHQLSRQ